MTSLADRPLRVPRRSPAAPPGGLARRTARLVRGREVALLAAAAVVVRLPLLGVPPSPDEAGFLTVGGQWHPGTSLYGDYWVDRPPLLVTLYDVAAHLGGLVALRLLGCVAVALVVVGVARVARDVAGPRAGRWAAAVAAAFCVDPLAGTTAVNGELLAAPFVVWGIAAALTAVREPLGRRGRLAALAAGAATVAAVLVKQNVVDVGVFAVLLVVGAAARREVTPREAARLGAAYASGALAALAAVAGWTVLHGTSLRGVYDAMYPFRLAAGRYLAASGNPAPGVRLVNLVLAAALSGMLACLALVVVAAVSRRRRGGFPGSATWALLGVLVYDVASIVAGGNYWLHYLVQPVVPLAVLAGVAAGAGRVVPRRVLRVGIGLVAVVAAVAWGLGIPALRTSHASEMGHALARVSAPGDTIVTLYGHADVTRTSGLPSPYEYLWSLPSHVRDPRLTELDRVLSGDRAPTWLVAWGSLTPRGVDGSATTLLVAEHYRPVAVWHGHTVFLRDGLRRAPPALPASTSSPTILNLPLELP